MKFAALAVMGIGAVGVVNPEMTVPVPLGVAQSVVDRSLPKHIAGPSGTMVTITAADLDASGTGPLRLVASGEVVKSGGGQLGRFSGEGDLVYREDMFFLTSPVLTDIQGPDEIKGGGLGLITARLLGAAAIEKVLKEEREAVEAFLAGRPVYYAEDGFKAAVLDSVSDVLADNGRVSLRARPGQLIGAMAGWVMIAAGAAVFLLGTRVRPLA